MPTPDKHKTKLCTWSLRPEAYQKMTRVAHRSRILKTRLGDIAADILDKLKPEALRAIDERLPVPRRKKAVRNGNGGAS